MLLAGVPVASMLPAAIAGLLLPARVLIAVGAATEVPARRRAMPTTKFRRRDPVKRDASMTTETVDAGVDAQSVNRNRVILPTINHG